MTDSTTPAPQGPQCPPVPDALIRQWMEAGMSFREGSDVLARWGFTQALAAAQELAADERQRGADDELEACCEWVRRVIPRLEDLNSITKRLRAARRPPAPTLREQAIEALRDKRHDHNPPGINPNFAVIPRTTLTLALQALEEAGDE